MNELALTPSLKSAIGEIVALIENGQPTGLIVDEIIRSSRIVDNMVRGGELEIAVREAEKRFSDQDFWTSPPERLASLVEVLRKQIHSAATEKAKQTVLVELLSQKRPAFLNG